MSKPPVAMPKAPAQQIKAGLSGFGRRKDIAFAFGIVLMLVILILPAMLLLFDRVICKTTLGMTRVEKHSAETEALNHA